MKKIRNQFPSAIFCYILSYVYLVFISSKFLDMPFHWKHIYFFFLNGARVDRRRETLRLYMDSWKVKTCAIIWIYFILLINSHSCSPPSVPDLVLRALSILMHLTLLMIVRGWKMLSLFPLCRGRNWNPNCLNNLPTFRRLYVAGGDLNPGKLFPAMSCCNRLVLLKSCSVHDISPVTWQGKGCYWMVLVQVLLHGLQISHHDLILQVGLSFVLWCCLFLHRPGSDGPFCVVWVSHSRSDAIIQTPTWQPHQWEAALAVSQPQI